VIKNVLVNGVKSSGKIETTDKIYGVYIFIYLHVFIYYTEAVQIAYKKKKNLFVK